MSLAAVVAARLDRLSSDARAVLRAASVLGETFRGDGTERLLAGAVSTDRVRASLAELVDGELLDVVQRAPARSVYRFRSPITRAAAYASATEDNRRTAHALAAEWLRASAGADPSEVAAHFERACMLVEALDAWLLAAEGALAVGDGLAAAQAAERALACGASGDVRARAHAIVARSRGVDLDAVLGRIG